MRRTERVARLLCATSPERESLLEDYLRMISFDGQREIAPGYIDHLRKRFMTTPLPELLQGIEQDKKDLVYEKQRWDLDNAARVREESRKRLNLRTTTEEYERTDDTFERAICSDRDPQLEKNGMPAFANEIVSYDKKLKGYYGVHVGGGWLPVMIRDEYCDGENAYVYSIDTSPLYNTKKPFYVMDDFHVMDRGAVPHSQILFSRNPVVPASLITLEKVIPVSKIKPAPDPY